jgi:hypothetical protein
MGIVPMKKCHGACIPAVIPLGWNAYFRTGNMRTFANDIAISRG